MVAQYIKILIVEDEAAHAESMQRELASSNMSVTITHVSSLSEYRASIAESVPDLAIMDLNLPDGKAVEVLTSPAEAGAFPILLMTSHGNEQVAVEAIKSGALDYVVKSPEAFALLPHIVTRALREWRLLIDRQQAVALVSEQEEELDAIYENAPLIMMLVDQQHRVCKVNCSGETFTNDRRAQILGATIGDSLHCLQSALTDLGCGFGEKCPHCTFRTLLHETLEHGVTFTSVEVSLMFDHKGFEREVFFLCSTKKLIIRKEPLVLVSLLDITERRTLEEQLRQAQKMDAIGRLAGGVAHDFNNMLNVVIGYTELALKRVDQDEKTREYLHGVLDAGRRSADLTRQLLAFSRKQVVQPRILDINRIINDEMMLLNKLISEDIGLIFISDPDAGPILMDPSQIDQILVNLVVNARDAIEGSGNITITTANVDLDEFYCQSHRGAMPGPYIRITVQDSGCGMDAATIVQIFEPFFTTKELGKGTGLGLATVYGIVKQNEGEIHAESLPGNGTTFVIHIPRQPLKTVNPSLETSFSVPKGSETILLVEDDESNLRIAQLLLEESGYTVISSKYPPEACKLYEQHADEISLLLSDVIMPELNGRELYDRIRGINQDIKVLFMSGYTDDVITTRGVLPEGTNFIHKPFTILQLAEKVRMVLDAESCI
ncbi:MAG: response regulator [Desulfuromonadaceae bacterium]|nr:response regulator [Desulfuromonadaceae bacterium]